MNQLYDLALLKMENGVLELCSSVPVPKKIPFRNSFVYRHTEKTIYQALVQKLARLVSSLHATRLLMEHGFYQEQGAMQRMLDELNEDILFLLPAVNFADKTPLHDDYLEAFFEEEFDEKSALASTQKRLMISRRKIQAYNARRMAPALDPSTGAELLRTLTKTYSGFIHAASPHIMDMYGGNPARFHVAGMLGTGREAGHRQDIWNYFYRSLVSFALVSKAFEIQGLFKQGRDFVIDRDYVMEFERCSGVDYSPTKS